MVQRNPFQSRMLFVMFALIASITFWSLNGSAQTVTGTLQGTVTDQNGAIVPGAEIVVLNTEIGQQRNLKTNSEGGLARRLHVASVAAILVPENEPLVSLNERVYKFNVDSAHLPSIQSEKI